MFRKTDMLRQYLDASPVAVLGVSLFDL